MEAVKDPGSGRNEAIERMVKEWQLPLLRLCYIQLHDKRWRKMRFRKPSSRHFVDGLNFGVKAAKKHG